MIKIKGRQEKITGKKPFSGPNVSTPGGSTGGFSLAGSQTKPNSLVKQPEKGCGKGVHTNHCHP
jgi:hypothetical protein